VAHRRLSKVGRWVKLQESCCRGLVDEGRAQRQPLTCADAGCALPARGGGGPVVERFGRLGNGRRRSVGHRVSGDRTPRAGLRVSQVGAGKADDGTRIRRGASCAQRAPELGADVLRARGPALPDRGVRLPSAGFPAELPFRLHPSSPLGFPRLRAPQLRKARAGQRPRSLLDLLLGQVSQYRKQVEDRAPSPTGRAIAVCQAAHRFLGPRAKQCWAVGPKRKGGAPEVGPGTMPGAGRQRDPGMDGPPGC